MSEQLAERYLKIPRIVAGQVLASGRPLPPGESPEDLAQVGAVALLLAVKRYDPARGVALSTWLSAHARYAMLDHLRRHFGRAAQGGERRRCRPDCYSLDESEDGPGLADPRSPDPACTAEARDLAARAMTHVAPGDREVVRLLFWGGLGLAEIARKLHMPPASVNYRTRRAMRAMREGLRREDI